MEIIGDNDLTSYLREPEADVTYTVLLANGIVSEVVGDLQDVPMRVLAITLEVAARAYRNPNGYASETVGAVSYRLPTETRQAGVYLTPSELTELKGFSGRKRRFSVRLTSALTDLP